MPTYSLGTNLILKEVMVKFGLMARDDVSFPTFQSVNEMLHFILVWRELGPVQWK